MRLGSGAARGPRPTAQPEASAAPAKQLSVKLQCVPGCPSCRGSHRRHSEASEALPSAAPVDLLAPAVDEAGLPWPFVRRPRTRQTAFAGCVCDREGKKLCGLLAKGPRRPAMGRLNWEGREQIRVPKGPVGSPQLITVPLVTKVTMALEKSDLGCCLSHLRCRIPPWSRDQNWAAWRLIYSYDGRSVISPFFVAFRQAKSMREARFA